MSEKKKPLMSASNKASLNRCSHLIKGMGCKNGFEIKPYCVGVLHPEKTPDNMWPECLIDD